VSDSSAQSVEIDHLKQTLFENLKEKESLIQTVTLLKNDFKKEEFRNIDRENVLEKKVNTTPVDYANSVNSLDPTLSSRPTKVEVPKELPKVSMVNMSLKKLKHHLVGFDMVVKERTTARAITEGSWGFEHTKACFRDEVIPFVKALKDLFNTFDQFLIDELSEVQNVFHQMEQAVEQYRLESKTFEKVLNENERLLEQVINKDIVNIIMNSSVDKASVNVHDCEKCLKLETELLNKKDFVKKEIYDKLFKSFTTLEKHCISLEVDTQLNQEIFQRDNSVSNQSAPSFDQLFELNELKAQSQEKDTVIKKLKERIKSVSGKMNEDKIKKDLEEIETINIKLDHRVLKLIAENEHLKQTYKQLNDSIKPSRIRSKKQCDNLINQVNLKSVEISDLNASLQEKVLVITALKDDLRKLKGKSLVDNAVTKHTIDSEMLKIDVEPITPKLLNKKTIHSAYIKHTQEEATVLRDLVEHVKSKYLLGVKLFTSASGSPPSGNTKKDKIQQTPSSTQKNKVEAHHRKVKSSRQICSLGYLDFGCSKQMTGDRSQLTNFVNKFLSIVKFGNDHVAKILGYGDYQIGNITISRVYYVEGLEHKLILHGTYIPSSRKRWKLEDAGKMVKMVTSETHGGYPQELLGSLLSGLLLYSSDEYLGVRLNLIFLCIAEALCDPLSKPVPFDERHFGLHCFKSIFDDYSAAALGSLWSQEITHLATSVLMTLHHKALVVQLLRLSSDRKDFET
ncbi:hypothetical protein Tco_0246204, partial [Tanacetum coccineum]